MIFRCLLIQRLGLSIPFLFFFSGCALISKQPSATLPENIPEKWQENLEVEDLPITRGLLDMIGRDESLCALIQEALENNPDIKATAARLQAEGYLLGETRSQLLPKLDVGFSAGRNNQEFNYATFQTETANAYKPSANISWELDLWGRLADQHRSAKRTLIAKEQDYLLSRDALAARVIQGWIKQLAAHRAVAIEEERVEILTNIEEILIRRYKDGVGTIDEYSTAASRTQIAKADLSLQRTEYIQAVRALEILLGRYPEGKLDSDLVWPDLSLPPVDAPVTVLANRPDIRAGIAMVEAAMGQSRAAKKAMLPSITLSGEIFRSSATLSDLSSATTYWGFLGSIFQPVFQAGKLRNESKAQQLEAEACLQDLQTIILRAMSEVENTLTQERELAIQEAALKIAEEQSRKSSLYFADRYRQGLDSIQSLLIAREQEISTSIRFNQAQADRLSNRVDMAIALGMSVNELDEEEQFKEEDK